MSPRLLTVQGELLKQCHVADLVVVRSSHEKQRVCSSLMVPEHKVEIVPLGIVVEEDAIEFTAPRSGIFHLSTYGQPRKNVARLIDAVGPTELPLTIAGHADDESAQRLAERAAPFPNIRFLRMVSPQEKRALFQRSVVFALPSLNEGAGLSAMEAAASGCKVVITRNGGPPDYFSGLGWLVDPWSVDDIRARIREAYHAPWTASQVDVARRRFSHLGAALQLAAAYERVLGQASPSQPATGLSVADDGTARG
jgi:glycosyltransferase involved in cell wall biosynthesis